LRKGKPKKKEGKKKKGLIQKKDLPRRGGGKAPGSHFSYHLEDGEREKGNPPGGRKRGHPSNLQKERKKGKVVVLLTYPHFDRRKESGDVRKRKGKKGESKKANLLSTKQKKKGGGATMAQQPVHEIGKEKK